MRTSLLIVTLAAALLSTRAVRADPVPWGYAGVTSTIHNNNNDGKTSSLTFVGHAGSLAGGSGFVPFGLKSESTAGTASPDSFTAVPFTLGITISDSLSQGDSGAKSDAVATFKGLFNASGVSTTSLLPGPTTWTSPTAVELVLGSDKSGWRKYYVELLGDLAPGQPSGPDGSLAAAVHIIDQNASPVTAPPPTRPEGSGSVAPPAPPSAPEPTGLVLAALALPALAYARRRLQQV